MAKLIKKEISKKFVDKKRQASYKTVTVECYDKQYGKRRVEETVLAIEARQAKRDKMSPQQQLEALDKKLGIGIGAVKERARLLKQIEEKKNVPHAPTGEKSTGSSKKDDRRPKGRKGRHKRADS